MEYMDSVTFPGDVCSLRAFKDRLDNCQNDVGRADPALRK